MDTDRFGGAALIIEDDMLVAWETLDIVERMGFSPVMVATTGHAANLAAHSEDLALIVCDLDLGSISGTGFDVLERIDPDQRMPTVIYTGINRRIVDEVIKVRRPGSIILNKPADEHRLREAVTLATSAQALPSYGDRPAPQQQVSQA